MTILVTDLDGTLLGGSPAQRRQLRDELVRNPEITVVFATGRGLSSIREVLRDPLVPRPRWIIGDIGATIAEGADLTPVEPLQQQLRAQWPGADRVRSALARFPALTYQDSVAQDARCSFYLAADQFTDDIIDAVTDLGCRWEYSAQRYFDVLPPTASKGAALRLLADLLDWTQEEILVAGDSLNDLSMFRLGTHGVVVSGAEDGLREVISDLPRITHATAAGAGGILEALRGLGWIQPAPDRQTHSLVVGYHRPPVHWNGEGWHPPSSPNGILPTLRSAFAGGLPGVWVSALVGAAPGFGHDTELPLSLMPLETGQWREYFHRACKETLWPILMSEPGRAQFDESTWSAYRAVNAQFAAHIAALSAHGATVWLHDYNLWLVPGLLRAQRPDIKIGLFHHTPFPPADIFAALPDAAELRISLECLDWVGFHTGLFAENFRNTLRGMRLPRIGIHPLGVDRRAIEGLARAATTAVRSTQQHRVLSVERLDYVKAPVQKVEAIGRLLNLRPDLRGQLTFRLICPPPEAGIVAYDDTRRILETRITEVNRQWGTQTWQPVDYVPRSLAFADIIEEYLAADVLWITSLQDGMNLTAKEFVAAHAAVSGVTAAEAPGVLVLSRHTGVASEFGDSALLTDPHSADDLSSVLAQALSLTSVERHFRLQVLSRRLGHEHPVDWAAGIVRSIGCERVD
ncbi:HAD-IIB family hydrolase [Nocardia fluminea]|uniref:HAD-IIB family hydrolase n=1 Tax=Nocardia fluminea TaxID=134984 RepID=UPI0033DC1EED